MLGAVSTGVKSTFHVITETVRSCTQSTAPLGSWLLTPINILNLSVVAIVFNLSVRQLLVFLCGLMTLSVLIVCFLIPPCVFYICLLLLVCTRGCFSFRTSYAVHVSYLSQALISCSLVSVIMLYKSHVYYYYINHTLLLLLHNSRT